MRTAASFYIAMLSGFHRAYLDLVRVSYTSIKHNDFLCTLESMEWQTQRLAEQRELLIELSDQRRILRSVAMRLGHFRILLPPPTPLQFELRSSGIEPRSTWMKQPHAPDLQPGFTRHCLRAVCRAIKDPTYVMIASQLDIHIVDTVPLEWGQQAQAFELMFGVDGEKFLDALHCADKSYVTPEKRNLVRLREEANQKEDLAPEIEPPQKS